MAERITIARPYARAAFETAQAKQQLAAWSRALTTAAAGVADPAVQALLGSPKLPKEALVQIFIELAGSELGEAVTAPNQMSGRTSEATRASVSARGPADVQDARMPRRPGMAESGLDPIGEGGANFLRLLVENRRLGLLPEIAQAFEALRAEAERTVEASVVSAAPLDDKAREVLAHALKKRLNREVTLKCETDPRLIGGAVIRAGDLVIDGSVRNKLERLGLALAR